MPKKKKEKLRKGEPQTFEEFVGMATRSAHSGLLAGGGEGLRDSIWRVLSYYSEWKEKEKP
jgi:hypothetical protein